MKRKELEKWYTICIIISSFVLIENIWYALTFAPDIRKEILYGIMLIMNLSYFFFMKYKKNRVPTCFYIVFCVYMFLVCIEIMRIKKKIRKEKKDANYVERRR